MTAIPTPVLLVGLALATLAVVALWKLLLVGGGILAAQWLMVTAAEDNPALVVATLAVPALVVAAVITHRMPHRISHRAAPGLGARAYRPVAVEEATR
ncbi:hypothetical protein ALI144C_02885 [Actinosynnema sp. ALI-1.44]|uniref:hypothetical protein n=1 Tax=Actinosynnema sp. ALI-1.44 TaxID=1933779 RepID=UPI00097C110C|nr:hypothetical protein [Actinosynnema sp. ALI-1.44]ONI90633.1 hypothetical protein ALI144C_02885 [Actinosynnema sp. ALI-1.44]